MDFFQFVFDFLDLHLQADWLLHNIIPDHVSDQLKKSAKYSENHKVMMTTSWKKELSILNSDRSLQKIKCVRSLPLCYYHCKEIVPGRGHRLCKSSQLQRALRRVIYGWQRISEVKISRIFVLSQMDFCLQGSQRAYFWLRWIARSGKTPSKHPVSVIRDKKSTLLSFQ